MTSPRITDIANIRKSLDRVRKGIDQGYQKSPQEISLLQEKEFACQRRMWALYEEMSEPELAYMQELVNGES